MVKTESYLGKDDDKIIKFLSTDDFMNSSNSPGDSVIASILDYQRQTNNFDQIRGSMLLNENRDIVGFLGTIAMPATYRTQKYHCVQTSSAFVNKEYPGNFKKILNHFVETNKGAPTFTIFPVPKIFSTFERMGFVEVNPERFKSNNYIIQDYVSFLKELLKNKILFRFLSLPIGFVANLLYCNKTKQSKLKSQLLVDFSNDYSKIEIDYKSRTSDLFVIDWNKELLENKFSNKVNKNKSNIKENEIIHICCFDNANNIIGSIVLKKVRNYKRFIISDIQTIASNRSDIVKSLINAALGELKHYNFNSIMYLGIEEIYSEIISAKFKCFKKSIDKRAYFLPDGVIPIEKISLVFSDDDLNY